MTQTALEQYIASLASNPLREAYRQVIIEIESTRDTLSDEFQIASEIHGIFIKYAERYSPDASPKQDDNPARRQ